MHVELNGFSGSGIKTLTFGVFDQGEIVPIAKISDIEQNIDHDQIQVYVRTNTIERFGPVRSLKLQMVFQVSYDSVVVSSRRKAGVALVNARVVKQIGNDLSEVDQLTLLTNILA